MQRSEKREKNVKGQRTVCIVVKGKDWLVQKAAQR